MTSKNLPLITLNNPLPFMNREYLQKILLKDNYSNCEIIPIYVNEVPLKIILKFPIESLIDQFMSDFNNKPISDKLNYILSLTKESKSEEEIKSEYKIYKTLTPFQFYNDYENEWKNNYSKTPHKSGLLYTNEEAKKIGYKAVKYLIAKFSKNIIQGKSVLTTSLPVFMFDKRTLHSAFAYEQRLAPIFLTKAAFCLDKIERLKWVTTYLISSLHFSVTQIKPFNPIIGETFQCRVGNIDIYIEQTVNHPITLNVYCKELNNEFILFGYLITDASIYINTVSTTRLGKFYIKFKDGTLFQIRLPRIVLKGISMGDRIFNYINKALVQDLTNGLCSFIEINPDEPGFISSFFVSKKSFPDYFKGKIVDLNNVNIDENGVNHTLKNNIKEYVKIEGEWTSYISFDNIEYWNNDKTKSFTIFNHEFILPSDGRYREDLINLIKGNQEQSQIEKEKLENRQRQDKKLREKYSKNQK